MNSKKLISFICALSLTLTLPACGSTENDDTRSRETAAATAQNGSQQSADEQGQQTTKQSESSDTAKDKLDEALGLKEQSPALSEDELKEKSARLDQLNILLNMDKRENEIVDGIQDEGEIQPQRESRDLER